MWVLLNTGITHCRYSITHYGYYSIVANLWVEVGDLSKYRGRLHLEMTQMLEEGTWICKYCEG